MSFGGATAAPAPKLAGIDASDTATVQSAKPLRYVAGIDWCPLNWITPIHNPEYVEIKTKVGKKTQTTGYDIFGDIAGVICHGLIEQVLAIESANTVVWEGTVTRPDDPVHPDYWRTLIVTSVGKFYVYWGRKNQPVDDILLAPLGAANPSMEHPAYRGQGLVICKRYDFAQGQSAPNTRIKVRRVPTPKVGVFNATNSAEGESLVAALLELATDSLFGAEMPTKHFTAAQWEALSSAVIARVGCHSPYLDRERALREVIKDGLQYFDGWARIDNAKIVPGMFPHDGTVPAPITEISHHDIVGKPDIGAPGLARTPNSVTVKFRNAAKKHRDDSVGETARGNAKARKRVQPVSVSAPWIIVDRQAGKFAAEAAKTGARGESKGSFDVRRPRAVAPGGEPLKPGDNFQLDWLPFELDQVSRITKRSDPYRGQPTISYVAERGLWPLPYRAPADLLPNLGSTEPTEIVNARVLELTTELARTPVGIFAAFLAKRPPSQHAGVEGLSGRGVMGFNVWYSADGGSYDPIGSQPAWAVRATLREAFASGTDPLTVKLTLDADNLDKDRLSPLSTEDQADDTLLLVIGEEVLSVGNYTIAGNDWDCTALRARQGSRAAAALLGAECWLVFRSELARFTHKRFVEDTTRFFKLQPYTAGAVVDLADVDALEYHFRDRAPEAPVIEIDALPAGLTVGVAYSVTGQISDVNGDLANYRVHAALLTAPGGAVDFEIALQSSNVAPTDAALLTFRSKLVFPMAGTWRVIVRADDTTGAFTTEQTAELSVGIGSGGFGPDDGTAPNPTSGETVSSGVEMLVLRWTNPANTPLLQVNIYEAGFAVKPALPSFIALAPQAFYFREGLQDGDTRYYWLEVVAANNRKSAVRGPFSGTVVQWPVIDDIETTLGQHAIDIGAAQADADTAITQASAAATAASNAQTTADGAASTASSALTAATTAQNTANGAVTTANAAASSASSAVTTANGASSTASSALSAASTAQTTANGAVTTANSAVTTANNASTAAGNAQATANSAVTAASNAQSTANGAASDASAAVTTASTAQAGVNNLAAEYVLKVETSGSGQRRVAGFRITNQGGAGGSTDFVMQADKVAIVNSTGANMKTPFAVVGGVVYLDIAMVRDATITSAKIANVLAAQIDSGVLNAMTLQAAQTATDSSFYNRTYGTGSRFPAFSARRGETASAHSVNGTENISLVTVWGWSTGSGFATDRFGKSTMVFAASFYSSFSLGATTDFADLYGIYRINGGAWQLMAPGSRNNYYSGGGAVTSDSVEISGLSGSDVIEFGVRLVTPAARNFQYAAMNVTWGNI